MRTEQQTPSILILGENENSAMLDKRALRDAGFGKTRFMSSGIAAARLLAGLDGSLNDFEPDIVVCSQKLADMGGEQFCALVRLHPRLLALPILLILPNDSEAEQLKTLGCGASALLGRPYSIESLKKIIANFAQEMAGINRAKACADTTGTEAFEASLATAGLLLRPERQPEDYFRVGLKCLQEKRWNFAITAFEKAFNNATIKAEAELGMAAAFKGKGDTPRFRAWLARASETFVRAKRWHKARTAYARLLQHDPAAKNPFLAEAHRLIRQKEYDEAADTLVQSLNVIPKTRTGDSFAKACISADDPEAMYDALAASLFRENGKQSDYLSAEIRQSLDILSREKEDRARMLAAERKWQLARDMAERKKREHDRPSEATMQPKGVELAPLDEFTADEISDAFPENIPEVEDKAGENMENPIIPPLTKMEATTELFEKKPKFNEFLSVVKLTWKLARRSSGKN